MEWRSVCLRVRMGARVCLTLRLYTHYKPHFIWLIWHFICRFVINRGRTLLISGSKRHRSRPLWELIENACGRSEDHIFVLFIWYFTSGFVIKRGRTLLTLESLSQRSRSPRDFTEKKLSSTDCLHCERIPIFSELSF